MSAQESLSPAQFRKGDRVQRKDGRTGTAVHDEHTTVRGEAAVVVRWDGSKRPPLPSMSKKLTRLDP